MAALSRHRTNTEIMNMLLEKADIHGYLTTEDLIEVYPDASADSETLSAVVLMLRHSGVDIVDEESFIGGEKEEDDLSDPLISDMDPLADLTHVSTSDTVGLYMKEMAQVPLLSVEQGISMDPWPHFRRTPAKAAAAM